MLQASLKRHDAVIFRLIRAGADVTQKTPKGFTALLLAANRGAASIVRAVLLQGKTNKKFRARVGEAGCELLNASGDGRKAAIHRTAASSSRAGAPCGRGRSHRPSATTAVDGWGRGTALRCHDGFPSLPSIHPQFALFLMHALRPRPPKLHCDLYQQS